VLAEGTQGEEESLHASRGELAPGAILGRYHVLRLLGRGGMGAVYEAYDPQLGRKVAVKVLHQQAAQTQESQTIVAQSHLIQEAQNLARISHPNIVPIYDVGRLADESVYLAMEFVAGASLRAKIDAKKVHWREGLALLMQAGEGLCAAHAAGLLHRDFKPENLMVGDDGRVRVLDFGIALAASKQTTVEDISVDSLSFDRTSSETLSLDLKAKQDGDIAGTPAYMAPEQFYDVELSAAADTFSFGCVLFEVLAGERPFPSSPIKKRLASIRRGRVNWPRKIPRWLRQIVEKSLAYQPEKRPASLAALLHEIRHGMRRDARRKLGLRVVLGLSVPLFVGTLALTRPEPALDPFCGDPSAIVDQVWNAQARQRMKAGFATTTITLSSVILDDNFRALETWREAWIASARNLCPQADAPSVAATIDVALQEQARACLNECKTEVATLIEIWDHPSDDQVLGSQAAVASLSAPRQCSDAAFLRTRTPLPTDPIRRQRILANEEKIKSARIRIEQVDWIGAERILENVAQSNQEHFELATAAEWAQAQSSLSYLQSGKTPRGSAALEKAVLLGIAADRPILASRALHDLWYARIYRGNLRDEGEERLRWLRTVNIRSGESEALVAREERSRAIWMSMHGFFAPSMPHFHAALAHTRQAFGQDSVRYAAALEDLGATSQFMGATQDAARYYEEALEIRTKILPAGHPERSRGYLRMATIFREVGDEYAAHITVLQGWKECDDAGLPESMCAELKGIFMPILLALGETRRAEDLALDFRALENQLGHRIEPSRPWTDQDLALILVERGEAKAGNDLAREALARMHAEREHHPYALVEALMRSCDAALAVNDLNWARKLIDEATEIANAPSEYAVYAQNQVRQGKGRFELALGNYDAAVQIFESLLADSDENLRAKVENASYHRHLALALLAMGYVQEAEDHAKQALAILDRLRGLNSHMRVAFYETLAKVGLARESYVEALTYLEQAHLAFDSLGVLENRRASLYFLQAQVTMAIDPSAVGRRAARDWAIKAQRAYLDWDAGAEAALGEVRRWLAVNS
jgi:serine/threonine protein kinase/tetratricopeptide (TPR) repeat protein